MAQLQERSPADVEIHLTEGAAADAVRDGTPLLHAGVLGVDPDDVLGELHRAAAALAETADVGTPGQRSAERLATISVDLAPLLGPALEADQKLIAAEAEHLGVDAEAFARLIELALQPFLWEAAARLRAIADLEAWDRGYCPVCAAWPALAELVGPEKRRVLRCVRCGSAWSWLVLLCPYCGNDDHRTLGTIQDAASSQRIDVCEICHGYMKALPSYTAASGPRIIAEDVATLDLDLIATDRGYRRPGDVDVAVAGIPRLVREGRALRPGGRSD